VVEDEERVERRARLGAMTDDAVALGLYDETDDPETVRVACRVVRHAVSAATGECERSREAR
jgi:hypothetical protein